MREATEAYERFRLNEAAARGLSVPLERSRRLVHRADQAPALRRRARRRRGPGRRDPDLRRGAAAAAPGDAVRHRGALAPVPRPPGGGLDLGGAVAATRPAGGGSGGARASSVWCRRWWAPSAASGPSTACSPGQPVRACGEPGRRQARSPRSSAGAGHRSSGLAKLSELVLRGSRRSGWAATRCCPTAPSVFVPLGDAIDVGRECGRLGAEVDRLAALVASQEKKLGNEQFVSRAPADVVERERQKLAAWRSSARCWCGSGSCWGAGERWRRGGTWRRPVRAAVGLVRRLAVAAVLSCARIEPPPGGPPDADAAAAHRHRPDSLAQLPGFQGDVEFRFDEVISEGSPANHGHRHRRPGEAHPSLAHDAGARRELAADPDHRASRRGLARRTGSTGWSCCRA